MTKHYASSHSELLSPLQNKGVINALPKNCTALVTTLAIMRIRNKTVIRFGVVTIERDAKIKKYFFRFYNMDNMNLLMQREIKESIGTPFTVVRSFFITIEINKVDFLFEFINTFGSSNGLLEFTEVTRALRGDLKRLKHNAQKRFYVENCHLYSYEKQNQFKRLLHGKKYDYVKKSKHEMPPSHKSSPNDDGVEAAKYALTNWRTDQQVRNLLKYFGINYQDVFKNQDCSQELDQLIAKYGGTEKFKQNTVQHGLGSGLGEISPASSTLSSGTSPESSTLSSVPKTPDKLVLERITAFDPAKQVEIPKNDDICKEKRLEEEEEFVAPEVIPEKDASSSKTTGEAASSSLAKPGTPEKVAEPAAKENVGKRILPDAFVLDINMRIQRMAEKILKRKAEKKLKKEQKAKKGQPGSTTPEQTPEKEAPMPTEKAPVKEASKTPEKNPSSVSDTTDETESDSENSD